MHRSKNSHGSVKQLIIDPEFSAMHTPLTGDERLQLTENIRADGRVLDPILFWVEGGGLVLDGEHRLEIAQSLGVEYRAEGISLPDRKAAMLWILHHQAGRRNLDSHGITRVRYKALQLTESTEAAADLLGVSKRTIERSREACQSLERLPEDIRKRYEDGSLVATEADMKRLGNLSEEEVAAVVDKLRKSPESLLHDVIPCNRSKLTRAEYDELKELCIGPVVRQDIASGAVSVDGKAIKKLKALPPAKQALVNSVLESGDLVTDLGEAVNIVAEGKPKRAKAPADVAVLADKLSDVVGKAARLVDEVGAALGDRSRQERENCISALQSFHELFKHWVGKYRV
jgi:ParB-like chromosome segregation protein Spo0J